MDILESSTHSFVIKIWLEETVEETGRTVWRGHITHVSSGERRFIKNLSEIHLFVTPYLQEAGVKLGLRERLISWLYWTRSEPVECGDS